MISTRKTDYDVIIVGGGLAGVSTALNLVRHDPSVRDRILILEKAEHPREKGCGGGINDGVMQWLSRHQIRLEVPPLEMKRLRIIIGGDDPGMDIVLDPADFMIVNREEFDGCLFRQAIESGIQALQKEPALSIHPEPWSILVRTSTREFTTRILVGADGATGIVRRALYHHLNCKSPARIGQTVYGRIYPEDRLFDEQELEAIFDFDFTFDRGIRGYAWSFPAILKGKQYLNAGICNFGTRDGDPSLTGVFSEYLEIQGVDPERISFRSHPIPGYHPDLVLSGERILLAGDSAGVDPLLGEGVSFALQYGDVAAGCILNALRKEDFSFSGYREELFNHGMARTLTGLWNEAEGIYHAMNTYNWRDLLYSTLTP